MYPTIWTPSSEVRGESEICSVWMSAWATPAERSAATTRVNCASAASSAWLAVRDCAWTPNEKCARSGTVVTEPRPDAVIERVGAVGLLAPRLLGLGDAGECRDGEDERGSDENA